jgi:hypothetical protein
VKPALVEGAGHHPPVDQRVPPINAFLDRTLGPVVTGMLQKEQPDSGRQ